MLRGLFKCEDFSNARTFQTRVYKCHGDCFRTHHFVTSPVFTTFFAGKPLWCVQKHHPWHLYTAVRKVFAEGQVLWWCHGGNESTSTTFSVQSIPKSLYQYLHCRQDIATVPIPPRKLCERECTLPFAMFKSSWQGLGSKQGTGTRVCQIFAV